MDEKLSGREVADLIGPGLARELGVTERAFTEAELKSLTLVLQESTALADAVGDGDADSLPTLFTSEFVAGHTEFDDFSSLCAASPWEEPASVFTVPEPGSEAAEDAPVTRHSSFLARTTAFETPGEMVKQAVIDRTRRNVESL
ncbi:hypothetical protein [Haloarchaeobius sp. TZWWS8]|uniref:hypothetical protein n=1 Tax=Haloarchaeobius sp. TZWWS8 TaxID=3446121 RepID=UPI003EBEF2D1